jgi:hypothetical protein
MQELHDKRLDNRFHVRFPLNIYTVHVFGDDEGYIYHHFYKSATVKVKRVVMLKQKQSTDEVAAFVL